MFDLSLAFKILISIIELLLKIKLSLEYFNWTFSIRGLLHTFLYEVDFTKVI